MRRGRRVDSHRPDAALAPILMCPERRVDATSTRVDTTSTHIDAKQQRVGSAPMCRTRRGLRGDHVLRRDIDPRRREAALR